MEMVLQSFKNDRLAMEMVLQSFKNDRLAMEMVLQSFKNALLAFKMVLRSFKNALLAFKMVRRSIKNVRREISSSFLVLGPGRPRVGRGRSSRRQRVAGPASLASLSCRGGVNLATAIASARWRQGPPHLPASALSLQAA